MASLRELWTKVSFKADTAPLEKINGTLEKVKSRLDLLAAGELLRGFAELTEKFGDFAIELQNSADAAGTTTDALQALDFAAGEAGIGTGEMGKALGTLTKKLQQARLGSEEANIAFGRAGITPDQLGSFHNSTEALKALSNTLRNIEDPIARAAAAQDTLGESGARMLKFLSGGSEGLDEAMEHAAKVGVIISSGQLENLAAGERAMGVFKKQMTALTEVFIAKLAPALRVGANALGNFLNKHRALINISFDKFLYNVGYAVGVCWKLFENLTDVFDALITKFPNAAKYVGIFIASLVGLRVAVGALGFVFGPVISGLKILWKTMLPFRWIFQYAFMKPLKLLLGFGTRVVTTLIGAFARMFAMLLPGMADFLALVIPVVSPFLAIAAAIAAIVVVSHDLWTLWKGGKFGDTWIGQALHAVKSFGGSVWDKLGFSMPDMGTPGRIVDKGKRLAGDVSDTAGSFFGAVGKIQERQGFNAAQGMVGPPYNPSHNSENNSNVQVDAPVTINMTGTSEDTVKQLSTHVEDAIKSQWQTVLKASRTQVTPAADY